MNASVLSSQEWTFQQKTTPPGRSTRRAASPMDPGVRRLIATAKENPWWTFTIEELAAITGYSRDAISAAKEFGARFPFGKSRPEWIMEWMAAHPRASLKNPLGEEAALAERR